ncbi:MAG TPA: SDR family oxidoreductase [Devosiaceae bacterium]|jgi:3-oxoacyl-[acyl-carrier protein] reductase|nr:SDR family oxidoreductase [Devosiaceae bacterium]
MDFGLRGKNVLVTGGSAGIGRAMVETFAAEGANVAFTYFGNRTGAQRLAGKLRRQGVASVAVRLDVNDHASVEEAVKAAREALGSIDVLVNNAVDWDVAFRDKNPDARLYQWQNALRANLEAPYLATVLAAPEMRRRKWGRILIISSDLAEDGVPGSASYSAAKAGLHGMVRGLCWDYGPDKVLINVIMPGLTDTEHQRRTVPAEVFESVTAQRPLKQITKPQDVADLAVFLCSARNRHITGEMIRVTGGW